ncbi:hypothetical protein I5L01_03805 [Erythrobacter sp. YJ-T3-07]|uniref:hypothetical protein n=1 Tax=Erythrobacter sp. YJ-T3-07 TaxID=2793063 RepID=UPI0018D395C9|nr:hypothetical protein [Erythrobacter sp. YJ-T3-07]MBH1943351.1 hypothetical protein [Erythrobacter sp. YJ-T3-07]
MALFGVFAGTVLGFTLAQFVRVRALCLADDVSCIREWMSALSGWAAGAAALIAAAWTVRVLTKQIRQGREQHIELMKFQAYERLLLVEQVGNQASMAHGTIAQIFHEFHDEAIEPSNAKLASYLDGAKFVLAELTRSDFASKRALAQGNLPSSRARTEVALPEFATICETLLSVDEDSLSGEERANILRGASTHLMLAYEDLKDLQREMMEFRRRWMHLSA